MVALNFVHKYKKSKYSRDMSSEYGIINDNITVMEVEEAIYYLKNNKIPGVDGIPSKFIKTC